MDILIGKGAGFIDDISVSTIRHDNCHFLIEGTRKAERCSACATHRRTLLVQLQRSQDAMLKEASHTAAASHVNNRYTAVAIPYI